MTDFLLSLITDYGAILLFTVTFLSCLALPAPSSVLMLTGGGFVASGELNLIAVTTAAYCGAMLGDQTGFWVGRRASHLLEAKMKAAPKRAALHRKASHLTARYGGVGVFLSRWLFSPLGPYVNFASGAAGMNWLRFTLWGGIGETVWVMLYVGLGYVFADRITELAGILGNASGFMAAGAVTLGLGYGVRHALRPKKSAKGNATKAPQ